MPKIAKLISITAALFALLAAQAGAVDLRSPDAVDAALQAQQAQSQDHRSPDAVDAANSALRGETVSTYTAGSTSSSSESDIPGFVALGIALTVGTSAVVVMTRQRRRRRSTGRLVGARS